MTHAVVGVESGVVREAPELVTTLGTSLLLRAADGSLKLEQRERRLALAPADCAGRVLFGDAARELALIACTLPKKPGKRQVWLLGAGYAKNLNVELYETATDREAVTATRLVPLYPGSEAALVDLERKDLLPLAAGSRVLARPCKIVDRA